MADDKPGPSEAGRRLIERRKSQQPFEGPERRKSERRTGSDRRTTPRTEDTDGPETDGPDTDGPDSADQ